MAFMIRFKIFSNNQLSEVHLPHPFGGHDIIIVSLKSMKCRPTLIKSVLHYHRLRTPALARE